GAFSSASFATGGPPGIIRLRMETVRFLFRPYPGTTADLPRPQAGKYSPRSNDWIVGFYGELFQPSTDALDPINAPTTRGAGSTAPTDTRLATPCFISL